MKRVRRYDHREVARKLQRAPKSEARDEMFRKAIRSIPKGKVATYGQVGLMMSRPLYGDELDDEDEDDEDGPPRCPGCGKPVRRVEGPALRVVPPPTHFDA